MPDYRRLVSYIYNYEDGKKRNNVGYARIETRNGLCKCTLHITAPSVNDKQLKVYFFRRDNDGLDGIQIGTMTIRNGSGDLKVQTDSEHIMNSLYGIEHMGGMVLYLSNSKFFATEWDDHPINMEVVSTLEKKKETVKSIKEETESAKAEEDSELVAANIEAKTEAIGAKEENEIDTAKGKKDTEFLEVEKEVKSETVEEKKVAEAEISGIKKEEEAETSEEKKGTEGEFSEVKKEIEVETSEAKKEVEAETFKAKKEAEVETSETKKGVEAETSERKKEIEAEISEAKKGTETEFLEAKKEVEIDKEKEAEALKEKNIETEILGINKKSESDTIEIKSAKESEKAEMNMNNLLKLATAFAEYKNFKADNLAQQEEKTIEEHQTIGSNQPAVEVKPVDDDIRKEAPVALAEADFVPRRDFERDKWEDEMTRNYYEKERSRNNMPNDKEGEGQERRDKPFFEDHPTAKYMYNTFEKVYPFEDNEIAWCVKIEPQDIGLLPMETWALGNNSYLLHGYYSYRHLIFARVNDDKEARYILGIPGIYHNREKFMARMFGFENFKSAKKKDRRTGEFGYWYVPVMLN